jgi:predicted transcriptional regulator
MRESIAEALSNSEHRRIIAATIRRAKSATELAVELDISMRSIYRYTKDLSRLGILVAEGLALLDKGGKYALYRSMVRSVAVKFDGNNIEVDLEPNEGILDRFIRFWSYMGR